MPTLQHTPRVRVVDALDQLSAELLVVPVFEDDDLHGLSALDEGCRGDLRRARETGELGGRLFEVFVTRNAAALPAVPRLVCVGAGAARDFRVERARRVATVGCLAARQQKVATVALFAREGDVSAVAGAMVDGAMVANFDAGTYKTAAPAPTFFREVTVVAPGAVGTAVERGRLLGESANIVRELCNEPGNGLTPTRFAERAADLARGTGIQVEILDERRLAELGTGLLLGVARGSAEPPRMIVLRHDPPGAPAEPVLGLVGKGITFDTGGISIKSADGMERMKDDMAGGAAVVAAMRAIGLLGLPVRVIGVIPTAENMPGSRAIKPGDVLHSASGKTVEVINTDAEGRLVLGDGLWYAQQLGATHLVDIATLTGSCSVALGKTTSGLFGRPDAWREQVQAASERGGDRLWPLPLFDDYREQLKSEIADFTNSGGRPGGAITAALFVGEFSGGRPWCHLDIAGTAWFEEAKPYMPKGPTGAGVRTLIETAIGFASAQRPRSG